MQVVAPYSNLLVKSSMDQSDRWAYPAKDKRDLRLDFMRGLIMIYVLVVHIECYSLFPLFAWERLGIISSAEGLVFPKLPDHRPHPFGDRSLAVDKTRHQSG